MKATLEEVLILSKKPKHLWTAEEREAVEERNLYVAKRYLAKRRWKTPGQIEWAQRVMARHTPNSEERIVYTTK